MTMAWHVPSRHAFVGAPSAAMAYGLSALVLSCHSSTMWSWGLCSNPKRTRDTKEAVHLVLTAAVVRSTCHTQQHV